jgi:hypothetical protein
MKIPRQYHSSKQLDRFMKDSLTSEKLFIYIMARASMEENGLLNITLCDKVCQ